MNAQELAAVKAVIRCIKEYKLEADYPLDPLERRAAQLEKPKSDKKRSGEFGRHHQPPKKSRANGGGFFGSRGRGGAAAAAPHRQGPAYGDRAAAYMGLSERYPYTAPNAYNYQVPSQAAYPQQTIDQRSYYYPQDDRVAPTSYNAVPPSATSTYGSYVGGGLQPSNQPYM